MIDFFKARTASWNLWRQKSRRARRTEARQRRAAEVLEPREVLTAVFGITEANELIRFDSASPQTVVTVGAITGLQQGEQVRGIDFRPATGQLYALGIVEGDPNATGRVYTVDILSGAATQVGSSTFSAALAANADWGFDFNPVPDRIRVVNDSDQNLRLHPTTGALAGTDTTLIYAATDTNVGDDPELAAVAYSNNTGGATATTLYGIDFNGGALRLVRQGGVDGSPSPNFGELSTVGSLGATAATADIGFDIDSHSGRAFASYQVAGTTSLFSVNLTSGAATSINTIGNGSFVVRDIAVINQPAASTAVAFAVNASNQLIRFAVNAPAAPTVIGTITGLQTGEVIKGIDFRPSTGVLFALGITDVSGTDSTQVYTLNTTTAVATAVGTVASTALSDTAGYGFDFNPVPDRIRVNNTDDQNIRLHPVTGGSAGTDTNLAFDVADTNNGQNPSIVGAAYTHSLATASSTTLYVIDGGLNVLARQGSPDSTPTTPNAGTLFTVGSLGITLGSQNAAFDIRGGLGTAFAALDNQATGLTGLYTLNLVGTSNVATFVGTIGDGNTDILAMAIAPETHLEVFLSNAGDTVTVDVSGGNLRVRNGETDLITPTAVGSVNSLRIFGGTGNDTVNVDATLANTYTGAFTFLGGAGVDGLLAGSATFSINFDGGAGASAAVTGSGNDTLLGGIADDLFNAGAGNDILIGGSGNDALVGGDGNDALNGGSGADILEGGAGSDTINGGTGVDVLRETQNVNMTLTNTRFVTSVGGTTTATDTLAGIETASLTGGASRNLINASAFTGTGTIINGGGGSDFIIGSAGNDVITTVSGLDSILGGAGADTIASGGGADTVDGGAGNDNISGGDGNDSLAGGDDNDVVLGNNGDDTASGGAGNDFLGGLAGANSLSGGDGNDTLQGHASADVLNGDAGNDRLFGFGGNDTLSGGANDDSLVGDSGADNLSGGDGNDTLSGGGDIDVLNGGDGADRLTDITAGNVVISAANEIVTSGGTEIAANIERLQLIGAISNDFIDGRNAAASLVLSGGGGNDTLLGGFRNDVLLGEDGDDVLSGGGGTDAIDGGNGEDFVTEEADTDFTVNGATVSSTPTGTETPVNVEGFVLIGGAGANLLDASAATVFVALIGGPGNDTLRGGSGDDILSGGNRGDSGITGEDGIDSLDGGAGSNELEADTADTLLNGTAIADVFANAPSWVDNL